MSRRVLGAALFAALFFLGTAAPQVTAKPPDLPLDDPIEVRPQLPPEEGVFMPVLPAAPMIPTLPRDAAGNVLDFRPASFTVRPAVSMTARRTSASCVLFSLHPALSILNTYPIVEQPCDHPDPDMAPRHFRIKDANGVERIGIDFGSWKFEVKERHWLSGFEGHWGSCISIGNPDEPVVCSLPLLSRVCETTTGSLLFGVGVNSDSGLQGNIVLNERNFDVKKPVTFSDVCFPVRFQDHGTVETAPAACPYVPQCGKAQIAYPKGIDENEVCDNLERLTKARELYHIGQKLEKLGSHGLAFKCFDEARALVPGSPVDAQCKAAQKDVLGKVFAGCAFAPCQPPAPVAATFFYLPMTPMAAIACPTVKIDPKTAEKRGSLTFGLRFNVPVPPATPALKGDAEEATLSPAEQCDCLIKASCIAAKNGRLARACDLVRQAYAIDPKRVRADELAWSVYQLSVCHPAVMCENGPANTSAVNNGAGGVVCPCYRAVAGGVQGGEEACEVPEPKKGCCCQCKEKKADCKCCDCCKDKKCGDACKCDKEKGKGCCDCCKDKQSSATPAATPILRIESVPGVEVTRYTIVVEECSADRAVSKPEVWKAIAKPDVKPCCCGPKCCEEQPARSLLPAPDSIIIGWDEPCEEEPLRLKKKRPCFDFDFGPRGLRIQGQYQGDGGQTFRIRYNAGYFDWNVSKPEK